MFETLRNFAEIGIAIAGFSAIASALRSRAAGEPHGPLSPIAGRALFLGAILLIGAQVGLAAFGTPGQLRFIYLVLLTWHSCIAGVMFGALTLRFLRSHAA